MISDVLFDAVMEIEQYLENRIYNDTYEGETREEINKLVLDMKRMICKLDCPNSPTDADIQKAKESVKH